MRTRPLVHRIPALLAIGCLAVAPACGGSDPATSAAPTTVPVVETVASPQVTTGESSAATTGETAPDETVANGPVEIDVVIGVDSGPDRVEQVARGADVTLTIVNGPVEAEYHVHGIDLEVAADADQTVTLQFVADVAGPYEVEDHETGEVVLVIEVEG